MTTYTLKNQDFTWTEAHPPIGGQALYGSSSLGLVEVNKLLHNASGPVNSPLPPDEVEFYRGKKRYELSNHLGNVLAVVSDKRTLVCISGTQYYEAEIITASDYYPFGMLMQERSYTATLEGYRYGFNGMEQDNETYGDGNAYDFGARIYDSRLGRWMSVDPLFEKYQSWSPYNFALNSPIRFIDPNGGYVIDPQDKEKAKALRWYARAERKEMRRWSDEQWDAALKENGLTRRNQLMSLKRDGNGPKLEFSDFFGPALGDGEGGKDLNPFTGKPSAYAITGMTDKNGDSDPFTVTLDREFYSLYQNLNSSRKIGQGHIRYSGLKMDQIKKERNVLKHFGAVVLGHETVHYLANLDNSKIVDDDSREAGDEFEKAVYGEVVGAYSLSKFIGDAFNRRLYQSAERTGTRKDGRPIWEPISGGRNTDKGDE